MTSRVACSAALLAGAVPALAHAHSGSGLGLGFAHPWSGLDHVLGMLAVGLWAAQLGGRALACIPASFLGLVAFGGALAAMGVSLPGGELRIVLSVLALGGLVACAARFPVLACSLGVGAFALFHGHVHGNELVAGTSALGQTLGFLASTALLLALGMGAASAVQRAGSPSLIRVPGAAIALYGLWLLGSVAA